MFPRALFQQQQQEGRGRQRSCSRLFQLTLHLSIAMLFTSPHTSRVL